MKTHLNECEKGHLCLFDQLLFWYGILQHVQIRWVDYFLHTLDLETKTKCKMMIKVWVDFPKGSKKFQNSSTDEFVIWYSSDLSDQWSFLFYCPHFKKFSPLFLPLSGRQWSLGGLFQQGPGLVQLLRSWHSWRWQENTKMIESEVLQQTSLEAKIKSDHSSLHG